MKQIDDKVVVLLRQYKLEVGCVVCGFNKNAAAIHFHHINEKEKKANISALVGENDFTSLLEELGKCTTLCANCHSIYHNTDTVERLTMESKFIAVDTKKFINKCLSIDAIRVTTHDVEILSRLSALEKENRLLRKRITMLEELNNSNGIEEEEQETTISVYQPIIIPDEIVIEAYKRLQSLNKTTKELYDGKVGAYYANKVKEVLDRNGVSYLSRINFLAECK